MILNNMKALNATRNMKISIGNLGLSTEKLNSGYRINKAGDDAAGLAISEKMRAQIRCLNQASINSQDSISFIQTTEGALNEVHSLLQRGRELCVKASNSTYAAVDRFAIQSEINNLTQEIGRIGENSEFNKIKCFPPNGQAANVHNNLVDYMEITYNYVTNNVTAVGTVNNYSGDKKILADKITQEFAPNAINQILNTFSAFKESKDAGIKIGLGLEANLDRPDMDVFADAGANRSTYYDGRSSLSYRIRYDLSDISVSDLDTNGFYRQSTAHELMHIVMDQNLTNGMLNMSDRFPSWFLEGSAEAVCGGVERIRNNVTYATNSALEVMLNDFKTDVYGAGYIATMYLGYLAGGSIMTSSNISKGLDKIYTNIYNGSSLSDAIKNNTSYSSLSNYENNFGHDAMNFARNLVAAAGIDGVGALIAPGGLSASSMNVLGTGHITVNSFILDSSNTRFENIYDSSIPLMKGGSATIGGIPGPTSNPGNNGGSGNSGGSGGSAGNGGSGGAGSTENMSSLRLQIGANSSDYINLDLFNISTAKLGINNINVSTTDSASNALSTYDNAINNISSIRGYYGAIQNRLEHTIHSLDNTSENLQHAESSIRDVDIAKEMMKYCKNNILSKIGQSILMQATHDNNTVLSLLQ